MDERLGFMLFRLSPCVFYIYIYIYISSNVKPSKHTPLLLRAFAYLVVTCRYSGRDGPASYEARQTAAAICPMQVARETRKKLSFRPADYDW